jgi:hypothetical protein
MRATPTADAIAMERSTPTCRTIGARPLGRACELPEREARLGTLDEADALLDRIRAQLAEVETFVRRRWAL